MAKPNLIVIGAQKSGTTWLHNRLGRHPDVFMSETKELNYFQGGEEEVEDARVQQYFRNFEKAGTHKIMGESSPNYFWAYDPQLPQRKNIPRNIRATLGEDLKLIAILRNPVARAISAYFHQCRMGRINVGETLIDSLKRKLGIGTMGEYDKQLEVWSEFYGRENFLFLCFDDVSLRPEALLEDVCNWAELASGKMPAPEARTRSDNPGGDLSLTETGITMTNIKNALLSNKVGVALMEDHPPMVRFEEIAELETYFTETYAFVRDVLGITAWENGFDAEAYTVSKI